MCVFFSSHGHVLLFLAWPVLQGDGLAALCLLVTSMWYITALCVACVSVIVSVNSSVLVRVFHLKSWAGPLFFRESAELQSPMEVATPPAQLFHCFSTGSIEEQPTPPSLTLLLVGRAGW